MTRCQLFLANARAAPCALLAFSAFVSLVVASETTSGIAAFLDVGRASAIGNSLRSYRTAAESRACFLLSFLLLFSFGRDRPLRSRWGLVAIMSIAMGSGVRAYARQELFLVGTPWGLIWTVALPAVWIVVRVSPRVAAFCLNDGRYGQPYPEDGGSI